ncbi:hypothetical protein ACP4OV_002631 [Aristida adscensionis]
MAAAARPSNGCFLRSARLPSASPRTALIRRCSSQPLFLRGSGTARPSSSSSRTPRRLLRPRPGPASTASQGSPPRCARGGWSAALNKVEHYGVQRVTGDGRCMFRALVKGMATNKGVPLSAREEVQDADDLRMAVKEVICDSATERQKYEEAIIAITVEQSLKRYCQRIRRPDFWGGESELLVLSKLCRQPIIIYIPEREYHGRGNGFIPITEYGMEFMKNSKQWKKRTPVRLLYSGRNHYDLLV